jgi:hypothetical protein
MRVKIAVGMENPVEEFAAMDEDPIKVGQGGENDAPLEFFPPENQKNDGSHDHEQMITDPHRAFKIRLSRVIGEIGQLVEEPMREKSDRGGQAKGQFAVSHALKGFLDDDSGEDVGGLLHGWLVSNGSSDGRHVEASMGTCPVDEVWEVAHHFFSQKCWIRLDLVGLALTRVDRDNCDE